MPQPSVEPAYRRVQFAGRAQPGRCVGGPRRSVVGDAVGKYGAPIYPMFEIEDRLADYTTPDSVIASTTGTAIYYLTGGTSPTMVYDQGSLTFTQAVGSLSQAQFQATFTTGTMTSITIAGNFPTVAAGNFTLSSVGPVPINSGFSTMTGSFTDGGGIGTAGCMGGCGLTGGVNYAFTSTSPGGAPYGIISSFNAFGFGIGSFGIAGTAFSDETD